MHYKTIVLELLEQQTEMYEQLRGQRMLLSTTERLALELKASHESWMERLARAMPRSDPSQVSSEALELATEELKNRSFSDLLVDQDGPSLDEAMAYLRRHTPPA